MDFQLVIVRGRSASTTIKLGDGVTTVGRQDDCQLRIKSSQVSRKHCELFEKKGLLLVKDLGSSNGTYVNGKRITDQRVLEAGDELTVGQVSLKVAKADAVGARPATAPKPGDTAVVEVAPVDSGDDEFEIEMDDDFEMSEPIAVVAKEEETVVKSMPEPKAKAQPKEPEKTTDDAVADFLLDLKFDDDE
ncbi:FHA domain-containing protein [Singulisphaera rosea]